MPQSALKRYDDIERRLRSFGAMRFIPGEDRRILFLDQARSLYALGRYDDALERIERESQFSGVADSRFSLLRGEITFRKATQNARAAGDDPQILEDALSAAQDDLQAISARGTQQLGRQVRFRVRQLHKKRAGEGSERGHEAPAANSKQRESDEDPSRPNRSRKKQEIFGKPGTSWLAGDRGIRQTPE